MKTLNIIRKLIKLPFALLIYPMWIIVGFVSTDWESEQDRTIFWNNLKGFIW